MEFTVAPLQRENQPHLYGSGWVCALQAQTVHLETLLGVLERFNGMFFVTVGDNDESTGQGWVVNARALPIDSASGVGGQTVNKYATRAINYELMAANELARRKAA